MLNTFFQAAFEKGSRLRVIILICVALTVITTAVYIQVGSFEFINIDDNIYVTENTHVAKGITVENIIWAFTCVDSEYWHPILWLSHMACVQFFGMNPAGHHLTNVAIHVISALLLFILLYRLTGKPWQSSFVAALFALHPMHVESVAWVTEKKDVLSAFFWFSTLLMYAEFTVKRKRVFYVLSLFLFILGLMSKPMLVTLPLVMLMLDFWPLGRYRYEEREPELREVLTRIKKLIIEKIPFFTCSLLSCLITIYSFGNTGAIRRHDFTSFVMCLENAAIAYVKYIGKTIWPQKLAIIYPFPLSIPLWEVIGSLLILLIISVASLRVWRRHPYLVVGWFWFLITLLPVIGLIKGGTRIAMADRFSYIPSIGLFIMSAWGGATLTKSLKYRKYKLGLLACAVVITSAALTYKQLGYWKNSITLHRRTLQITKNNPMMNLYLGAALAKNGDFDAASQELLVATEYYYNSGVDYFNKGNMDEAIDMFTDAISVTPDYMDTHNKLGVALARRGYIDEAIQEFREELRIHPDNMDAEKNMKLALGQKNMQNPVCK